MEIKKTLTEGLLTLEYGQLSSHILLIHLNEPLKDVSSHFKNDAIHCSPVMKLTGQGAWEQELIAFDLIPPIELRCIQDKTLTAMIATSLHKRQGLSFLEYVLSNLDRNVYNCREDYQKYFARWFEECEVPTYQRVLPEVKDDVKIQNIAYEVQLYGSFLRDAAGYSVETAWPLIEYRAKSFGLHENKTIFNHSSGLWMVVSEGVAKSALKDTRKRLVDRSYLLTPTVRLKEPHQFLNFRAARLHPYTEAILSINSDRSNYFSLKTYGLSKNEVESFHRDFIKDGELEIREPNQVNIQNAYRIEFMPMTFTLQKSRKGSYHLGIEEKELFYQAMCYGAFLKQDRRNSKQKVISLVKKEYAQLSSNAHEVLRKVF